jgi:hypothetical protein
MNRSGGVFEDLALTCPHRGFRNVSCKYDRSLEYWSNGMMEKPVYASLFPRRTRAKHESLRIVLAAARINTPLLHHSLAQTGFAWTTA